MKATTAPKDWDEEDELEFQQDTFDEDTKQMVQDYWNSEEGQQHAENID